MNSYREVKKRGLAIVLALLTVITTWSADLNALAAGTYSRTGETAGKTVAANGQLAQVFTAQTEDNNKFEQLSSVSLKLDVLPYQMVNYTVSVYQNLTDHTDPTSGVLSYTSSQQQYIGGEEGDVGKILTTDIPAGNCVFANNETYGVIYSFSSSQEIYFYEGGVNSNGFRRDAVTIPVWENIGNVIEAQTVSATTQEADTVSIHKTDAETGDTIVDSTRDVCMVVGQTLELTVELQPSYKRYLTLEALTPGATAARIDQGSDYNKVSLEAFAPGLNHFRITCGSSTYEINVYVFTLSVDTTGMDLVYSGTAKTPSIIMTTGEGGVTKTITASSGNLEYSNNINAGTASVKLTNSGYTTIPEQTLTYEITKKEITQAMVDAASFTIDKSTEQVTDGSIQGLEFGRDYTATARLTSISDNQYHYEMTVTGINSCYGTLTRNYSVSMGTEGSLIDINDMVTSVSLNKKTFTYDGDACEPTASFYGLDGNLMSAFEENCNITYENNVDCGTATMIITGKEESGYTGTMTKTFTIAQCRISPNNNISVTLDQDVYEYTGSAIKPQVTMKLTSANNVEHTLVEGTDYSLSYSNNTEISKGNATVTIKGTGNLKGTITKSFDIIGNLERDAIVFIAGDTSTDYDESYASSYEESYSGSEIEPEIEVYMGSEYLEPETDYVLTYENNINAGTATAVVTGAGVYAGKVLRVTYTIVPVRITAPLQITAENKVYTGNEITLANTEDQTEYQIAGLTEETDYTISYQNNVNAGTATVTATGKNNYTGTVTGTFRISARALTDSDITVGTIEDQTYTGTGITPQVQLFYKGDVVPQSSYSVSYSNNVDIGLARATITGSGNLTGSIVTTFVIKAKTMDDLKFYIGGQLAEKNSMGTLVSPYETSYTGTERKPDITVIDGSTTLRAFRDYTIGYANNINSGQGILYITGAGAYQGSVAMVEFTITPKDIASEDITVVYRGSNYKDGEYTLPYVTITDTGASFGKQLLALNTAYTVSGTEECKTSGDNKTATITGTGNYTGTTTVTYIIGNDISDTAKTNISLSNPYNSDQIYTKQANNMYYITYIGQGASPKVGITYQDGATTETLQAERDYHVQYRTTTAANGNDIYTAANDNTIEVTITGMGDYYGTVTLRYLIMEAAFTTREAFKIINNDTASSSFTYDYDGSKKDVNLQVSYLLSDSDKISLVLGTDYTLSTSWVGPEMGTHGVTLTGIGNYQGTMVLDYIIAPKDVADATRFTIEAIPSQEYTTNEITPDFVITDTKTGKALVLGEDITVQYTDNVNVGTGHIVVTGINNYYGTRTIDFAIVARSVADSNVTIRPIPDQTYTGREITPSFQMYYGVTPLVANVDYDYAYTDNTAPGKGVITVTGKGTYAGQTTVPFNIIGDLSDTTLFSINGVNDSYYLRNNVLDFNSDTVTVKYAGNTIRLADSNYTIRQDNCQIPGMGKITFVGQNYCTGVRSVDVKVIGNLNEAAIENVKDAYDYTGAQITPVPRITLNGNVLVKDRDYTVSYGDNLQAGTGAGNISIAPVTDGYYIGSNSKDFDIVYNLDDAVVTGVNANYKYTGAAIRPSITSLTVNGKTLPPSAYTVSYGTNTQAGTGTIVITGNSAYVTGSKTITFQIDGISIMDATVLLEGQSGNYVTAYTGDAIRPIVTVTTSAGTTLVQDRDYTVSYSANTAVGTASVRVLGTGNYSGAVDRTFTITQKDLGSADVEAIVAAAGYAGGRPVTPQMTVTYRGRTLVAGVDYSFTVSNNTNVTSSAYVTFTGQGNYTGSKIVNFEVTQTDLSKGMVVVDATSSYYTGQAASIQIQVRCPLGDGEYYTLEEGKDYDVTYGTAVADMIKAGVYQIQITGKQNFINSLNTTYTIMPKSVAAHDVEVTVSDMDYAGQAVYPTVQVKDTTRNVILAEGTDYSLSYSNNILSASANQDMAPTVTINGRGNYGETIQKTFNIGETLTDLKVNLTQEKYTYDGQEHKPEAIVTNDGRTLVEGIDYTLEYMDDCVNAGSKSVTVLGMGQYYGTVTAGYTIEKKIANPSKIRLELNLPTNEQDIYHVIYNGSPVTPEVTVYDDEISSSVPLRIQDYAVTYRNNNVAGTVQSMAYAVVSLKGNYAAGADTYRIGFIIEEKDISDSFQVTLDSYRYLYTGEAIVPVITVTGLDSGRILNPITDYDVILEDNINAGKATVRIVGKGNYSGSVETNFAIYASLAGAQVTIDPQFYTGNAVYPPVNVVCGGNQLIQDEDYTVAYYSDDDYTTSGYVIITPLNSYYSDSATAGYSITFAPELLKVDNYLDTYTYSGEAIMPEFKVTAPDGSEIAYDKTQVTYADENGTADCTDIGRITASIPVTLAGQNITLTAEYTIIPRNINTCQTIQLENNAYTGIALTPPVIVKHNGKELVENVAYTVAYGNNTNPGVADAVVTGIGNYTGTKTLHYSIVSPAMINLKATPASESAITLSWSKNPHISGYEIYSGDCRTLYGRTPGNTYTVAGLQTGTEYLFKVRTYVIVNGVTTYGDFKAVSSLTNVASTSITVRSISRGRATINWSASANVAGYEIYRSTTANGTYSKIAVMPRSAGGYTDSGLTSGNTYYYKVRAYQSVNGSYVYGAYSPGVAITVK